MQVKFSATKLITKPKKENESIRREIARSMVEKQILKGRNLQVDSMNQTHDMMAIIWVSSEDGLLVLRALPLSSTAIVSEMEGGCCYSTALL